MSSLTLQKVEPDEVEPLQEIVRLCGEDTGARFGLMFWAPPPPIELMRHHAAEKAVYAVGDAGEAVATFKFGLSGWPEQSLPFWAEAGQRVRLDSILSFAPPVALYRRVGYEERGVIEWTNWFGIIRELLLMEKMLP